MGICYLFLDLINIFQAIYDWATFPMDLIDTTFASLAEWVKNTFPGGGMVTDLVAKGSYLRNWRDCHFYSTNCLFIFIHFYFRRKWLYESCGLFNGPCDASIWIEWKKFSALNFWNGLCHSSRDGHPKY